MNVSFKGYDACPIKKLYIITGSPNYPTENKNAVMLHDELAQIGEQEGFGAHLQEFKHIMAQWAQDYFTLRPNNSIMHAQDPFKDFYEQCKFNEQLNDNMPQGGNIFIGKKPDGETFILVGEDFNETSLAEPAKEKRALAQAFDTKLENVYVLPQVNFHLDTFMRPIGYPYVLINDPKLAVKNLRELLCDKSLNDNEIGKVEEYITKTKDLERSLYEKYGSSTADLAKKLKDYGFTPVKIGAVYGGEDDSIIGRINFMNAIVNKRKDGTISYVTNASPRVNKVDKKLEDLFEKQLREIVSRETNARLNKVYFVQGRPLDDPDTKNSVSKSIIHLDGGVHCMCAEEPNFDAWV